MRRFTIESLEVTTTATLLGCKPNSGLINTLNDLKKAGLIKKGDTYGAILKVFLIHLLAEHHAHDLEDQS